MPQHREVLSGAAHCHQIDGALVQTVSLSVSVGEPITVPKIEDPTAETVDLYHGMYIKSLLSLFDKYKARFGLKESDVLHIL